MPRVSRKTMSAKQRNIENRKRLENKRASGENSQKNKCQEVCDNGRKKRNERNSLYQAARLSDSQQRTSHKARVHQCQSTRLADPKQRTIHRIRISQCQKIRLANPAKRIEQRQREKIVRKRRNDSPIRGPASKMRRNECQKKRLCDPLQREAHLQKLRDNQQIRMNLASLRHKHLARLREAQQNKLQDPIQRILHISRVLQSRRKRNEDKSEQSRKKIYEAFLCDKKLGPSITCDCCRRLWFKSSVRNYDVTKLHHATLVAACGLVEGDTVKLCSHCSTSIKKHKLPTFSINRGMELPHVPEVIKKLTELESRFLSPRIPFMAIRAARSDQQYIVKGRAINIPINVDTSVKILPRTMSESECIPICFKRKRAFKSNVAFENVRPKIVQDAANYLVNSPLYKFCDIKFDSSRFQEYVNLPKDNTNIVIDGDDTNDNDVGNIEDDDEENEPVNVADDVTMLANATVFAPGEGNKPESLFSRFVESQSFLRIFGGELIEAPDGISFQNWSKSLIMREDRRCADVPFLFFVALKLRNSKVASGIHFCMRKAKSKIAHVTVKQALNTEFLRNLEIHDSGFKIFAGDRGSPAFWEAKKKEVFAMIRQLGPCSIFLTLSPAETRWGELLKILKLLLDKENISSEDAASLPYPERVRLVKSDPVTVARYFEYRMRCLFNILKKPGSVFRDHPVEDFYIRTEFQQRGSPHVHCILWLKDAPKYSDAGDNTECIQFIDDFISCSSLMPEEHIQLQSHRHTFTCKGTKNDKCRFDIPFMPLKETMILHPVAKDEMDVECKKKLQARRRDIKEKLCIIVKNKDATTLDELLHQLNISYDEYILIIRSGLKRVTVYLQRTPQEAMINFYNPDLLQLHEANMDIMYITDIYSCATYVLDYLNKSNNTMSKLLRDIEAEIRSGNYSMAEQFKLLGSSFLNGSEFSAQEAVYYILGLPLSRCSRTTVFINTNHPDKRVAMLKPQKELEKMRETDPDSTNVYASNDIERYALRPSSMESICLADFVALYNYSKTAMQSKNHDENNDNDDDYDCDSEWSEAPIRLMENAGFIKRRSRAKIIRFVNYNDNHDDYKRENVMLFYPWREEHDMILHVERTFETHIQEIKANRARYVYNEEIMTEIVNAQARREIENNDDDDEDMPTRPHSLEILGAADSDIDNASDPDMQVEKHMNKGTEQPDDIVHIPVPNILPDDEYADIVCTLNAKQRKFLLHVLHCFKTNQMPIYHCLMGGAGVGKSRLIEGINQAITRYLNTTEGSMDTLKVLLCAPTGKAAFGIKGTTLHSAFALAVTQNSSDQVPLSSATKNTLYSKLRNVKLIIIDEISMVGARLISNVDKRLQQIFQRDDVPFAGLSVIVFGDFNQLGPIGDSYIFKFPKKSEIRKILINPLWNLFTSFTLTEIMRQRDDAEFAEALNSLARGCLDSSQIKLFQNRVVNEEAIPKHALRLYRSNNEVNTYNDSVVDPDKNKVVVHATDKISGQPNDATKTKLLKLAKESPPEKTQGLSYELKISLAVKYMITVNIDVGDGLVNGAIGTIEDIDIHNGEVLRVWMKFPQSEVGRKRRREITHGSDDNLTAIEKVNRNLRLSKSKYYVIRKQFPLRCAESITLCKSQGGTYNYVAAHLKPGMKRSEIYVALSRCTQLSGLYITGTFIPPKPPLPTDEVVLEVLRLQSCPVKFLNKTAADFEGNTTIVYQNVQSINNSAHWRDFQNFLKITKPTIFIAAETWTLSTDNLTINGYNVIFRLDVPRTRHANGLLVLSKTGITLQNLHSYHNDVTKSACCIVCFLTEDDVAVCSGYKPPSTSYNDVRTHLMKALSLAYKKTNKVVFVADFNVDCLQYGNHLLFQDLQNFGMINQLPAGTSTTNGNTGIDVVYSSFPCYSRVSETLYSYHKQLILVPDRCPDDAAVANVDCSSIPAIFPLRTTNTMVSDIQRVKPLSSPIQTHLPPRMTKKDKKEQSDFLETIRRGFPNVISIGKEDLSTWPVEIKTSFHPIVTSADGNCFYHAISQLLCGNESLTVRLRELTAQHLAINENFINEIPLSVGYIDTSFADYVDAVKSDGNYAEIFEVILMTYILEKAIVVYMCDGDSVNVLEFNDNFHITPKLHIGLKSQHYTALRPKVGVNLPKSNLVNNLPSRHSFMNV